MTTTKMLGLVGLLLGLTVVPTTDAPVHGCAPGRYGVVSIFDSKGSYFGSVVRDGDRFVALRFRQGDRINRPRNFNKNPDTLEVDDKYLGYDLRGKNKNVLVRESRRPAIRDIEWEFVSSEAKSPFLGYFRVKNGDLKGWWIGLGALEPANKEGQSPWDRQPRAPLILVKDKKNAAGFDWTHPEDEESR